MVADIEELEEMDASELHARRLNAKEVLTPQRSGNFIFPVADGSVKSAGIENTSKNDDEELQSGELQGVPDWPQEFKRGLVDESIRVQFFFFTCFHF